MGDMPQCVNSSTLDAEVFAWRSNYGCGFVAQVAELSRRARMRLALRRFKEWARMSKLLNTAASIQVRRPRVNASPRSPTAWRAGCNTHSHTYTYFRHTRVLPPHTHTSALCFSGTHNVHHTDHVASRHQPVPHVRNAGRRHAHVVHRLLERLAQLRGRQVRAHVRQ